MGNTNIFVVSIYIDHLASCNGTHAIDKSQALLYARLRPHGISVFYTIDLLLAH